MARQFIEYLWNELYIEMLSSPDPEEQISDVAFAESLKISLPTLKSWKGKYRKDIFDEVHKRRMVYINQRRAILDRALDKKVSEGDTQAIKLGYQLIGDLIERTEVKTDQMTEADKVRRVKTLLENAEAKKKAWSDAGETGASKE